MAARRISIWRAVVAATVVATGLAFLWGLGGGWVSSLVELAKYDSRVSEDIDVAADGTPVISIRSRAVANSVTMSRRTLDGKSWPVEYENWIGGAYLAAGNPPAGVIQLPLRWYFGSRVIGGTDGRRPPSAWYVVRDDRAATHCYLAGFDAFSNLSVGYIGRNGYQAAVPAANEQFELPDTNEQRLQSFVSSPQYLSSEKVWNHTLNERSKPPGWLVFIAEREKLWEIDLRRRTARAVVEAPAAVSVSQLNARKEVVDTLASGGAADELSQKRSPPAIDNTAKDAKTPKSKADALAQAPIADDEPRFAAVIAVRTDDRIIVYDPMSGRTKEFTLPTSIPNKQLTAYWIAPEQLLIEFNEGAWSGGQVQQLVWIDAAGKVARKAEAKIAGYTPDSPRAMAWVGLGLVPVTIVWLVGLIVGAPLTKLQNHTAVDYSSAIAECFRVGWLPFVVLLVISGLLVWLTLRLQRKYRRSHSGVWAGFVFLLGLPGFAAYLVEHRGAKLEACAECGEIVPRDRDACAACDGEFAPPPRVGTEIFA